VNCPATLRAAAEKPEVVECRSGTVLGVAPDLFDDLRWRGLVYQVTDEVVGARLAAGRQAV